MFLYTQPAVHSFLNNKPLRRKKRSYIVILLPQLLTCFDLLFIFEERKLSWNHAKREYQVEKKRKLNQDRRGRTN